MKRLRILCSDKIRQGSPKTQISHVGGVNGSGQTWKISVQEAIKRILSGEFEFYIVEEFQELNVTVSAEDQDQPSLFVTAPGFLHNFLEDLPDCPQRPTLAQ